MNLSTPPLILLGYGYVAERIHRLHAGGVVWATTRSGDRLGELTQRGVTALRVEPSGSQLDLLPEDAHVVVSFPPDGRTDAAWVRQLPSAARIVYVSSTGVYPTQAGHVDDGTPVAPDTERGHRRLAAESIWRRRGAVVLRAPAIYGPTRGLLQRLRAGQHRLVEGGGRVSRIHVDDLAHCVLAALQVGRPGAEHVVGDMCPSTQREIVQYICDVEGLPFPEEVSNAAGSPTLRGDRAVDPLPALTALSVKLRYPSFREGLAPLLRVRPDGATE